MTEEKPGSKARPLGATGETVRANIIRLREAQRMPVTELSAALDRLGRPIPALGVRRIEAGDRRVDVDDLMALAVALGVSPASLLMPEANETDVVPVTGWNKPITASVVWRWITAEEPLINGTLLRFIHQAWPSWISERWLKERSNGDS